MALGGSGGHGALPVVPALSRALPGLPIVPTRLSSLSIVPTSLPRLPSIAALPTVVSALLLRPVALLYSLLLLAGLLLRRGLLIDGRTVGGVAALLLLLLLLLLPRIVTLALAKASLWIGKLLALLLLLLRVSVAELRITSLLLLLLLLLLRVSIGRLLLRVAAELLLLGRIRHLFGIGHRLFDSGLAQLFNLLSLIGEDALVQRLPSHLNLLLLLLLLLGTHGTSTGLACLSLHLPALPHHNLLLLLLVALEDNIPRSHPRLPHRLTNTRAWRRLRRWVPGCRRRCRCKDCGDEGRRHHIADGRGEVDGAGGRRDLLLAATSDLWGIRRRQVGAPATGNEAGLLPARWGPEEGTRAKEGRREAAAIPTTMATVVTAVAMVSVALRVGQHQVREADE